MRKRALALLAGSTALALAGCVAAPPAPTPTVRVVLPEWLAGSSVDDLSDLVLLSEGVEDSGDDLVYSGRDAEGAVCIAVASPPAESGTGDDWFLSSGCVSLSRFADYGAMVSYSGTGGRSGGAHLLPPGFDKPLEAGWTRVSPQLAIRD